MDDDKDDVIIFNGPNINMYEYLEDGESLFEKYFRCENMTADKRNFCYMLLNHIKEVTNSNYVYKFQKKEFELGSITFRRNDINKYGFYGVISNGDESKTVDGVIIIRDSNIEVSTNFYRFNEFLEDDERFYSTVDLFYQDGDEHLRTTIYSDGSKFVEHVNLLTGEEIDEYAYQKSKSLVKRKENEMSN